MLTQTGSKVVLQERRDFRSDRYNNNRPIRDYAEQSGSNNNQVVRLYSESQCIKYWEKSRTNPSSNDPTKWWEILKSETETSIVNIIKIMVIQQRIAEAYGIS